MLAVTVPITGDQDGLQEQDLQTQQSCSALSWNMPIIIWFSIATRRFGMGTTDVTGTSGSQLQPPHGAPVQAPHWCICIPSLVFTSYKLVFMSYHLTGAVKSWQPLQISVLPLVHGRGSSHLWQWFPPCEVDGCTVLKSYWGSKVMCQHSTQTKFAHCCSEGKHTNMPLRSGGIWHHLSYQAVMKTWLSHASVSPLWHGSLNLSLGGVKWQHAL